MSQITYKVVDGETHYSCGCKDRVVGENYFFEPCSTECKVFHYAIEQSHRQGNKISTQITEEPR